jgi:FixJ family two-component response regulator
MRKALNVRTHFQMLIMIHNMSRCQSETFKISKCGQLIFTLWSWGFRDQKIAELLDISRVCVQWHKAKMLRENNSQCIEEMLAKYFNVVDRARCG